MATIKSRELCKRTRLADGVITYHLVDAKNARRLVQIGRDSFADYEARAERTDCLFSETKRGFRRDYKTVYFN